MTEWISELFLFCAEQCSHGSLDANKAEAPAATLEKFSALIATALSSVCPESALAASQQVLLLAAIESGGPVLPQLLEATKPQRKEDEEQFQHMIAVGSRTVPAEDFWGLFYRRLVGGSPHDAIALLHTYQSDSVIVERIVFQLKVC